MAKHYDEKKVLHELGNKGVQINFGNHQIVVNTNKNVVGISSLGKLDFLVHYCGWRCIFKKENIQPKENEQETNYKKAKKESRKANKAKKQYENNQDSQKGFLKKSTSASKHNMNKILKRIKQ